MMLSNLLCSVLLAAPGASTLELAPLASLAPVAEATVEWSAPGFYIAGAPYEVELSIEIPASGASLPVWAFSPAAFSVNGEALGKRSKEARVDYVSATTMKLSFDLAKSLSGDVKDFKLTCDIEGATGEQAVRVAEKAPAGLDFMSMPAAELGKYWVLMETNRGDMLMEFWPQYAPKHVANFLDLCYTGFYDGVQFHRVIPGFMIQGGDPTGTGSGNGPRQLDAEFSDPTQHPGAIHVPGVLSMARTGDPNSASCQFFVMHARAEHLDGQYSVFGKLVSGLEVVELIVQTPRAPGDRPKEKQLIVKTTVLLAPSQG